MLSKVKRLATSRVSNISNFTMTESGGKKNLNFICECLTKKDAKPHNTCKDFNQDINWRFP